MSQLLIRRPTKWYSEEHIRTEKQAVTVGVGGQTIGETTVIQMTHGQNPFPDERDRIVALIEARNHVVESLRLGYDGETGEMMTITTYSRLKGTTRRVGIHEAETMYDWKTQFTEQSASPDFPPEIGSGATIASGSDGYPFTVIAVTKTGKTLTVQSDDMRQVGDFFGNQRWVCSPNPQGGIRRCRWNEKRGMYVSDRRPVSYGRHPHLDPSF